MQIRDEIDAEIYSVGAELIDSPFFQKAKQQKHHRHSTLDAHVHAVARWSVRLCDHYERKGKRVNRKQVIIAALCHDLGMIGREEKYARTTQAWRKHPGESERLAAQYFPEIRESALKSIHRHMWPLTLVPPLSLEQRILSRADKLASVGDVFHRKKRTPSSGREKVREGYPRRQRGRNSRK